MSRPTLAVTMGDPAGIGPEIVAKALARPEAYDGCRPIVVGDVPAMRDAVALAGAPGIAVRPVAAPEEAAGDHGTIDVLQPDEPIARVTPGRLSPEAGRAAVAFVRTAAHLAVAGAADAIVTAPLNKEAMQRAGLRYPGHTELLAEIFGVERYSLVLTADDLFVFHVTTHVSLSDALNRITGETVLSTIELAHRFACARGWADEAIAVAGVNPHAGENGLFGDEEARQVEPAIAAARRQGIPVVGPLPADALWPAAVAGRHRLLVTMYHDQGHAPFKAVYGDRGVNITVGLPVLRTSVDHGTAFDIAGRGIAREASLVQALSLARDLAPGWHNVWRSISAAA
jgi:4-hydroxythreonine-4-phosphate dehydrogenase